MARINRLTAQGLYRKEPISSFLIIMGLIEVVIGGVDGHWGLFVVGLALVLGAIAVRWSRIAKSRRAARQVLPHRYLSSGQVEIPSSPLVQDKQRS